MPEITAIPANEEDINAVPVETLEVNSKPSNPKTVIGSEEFIKEASALLSEGPVWRSSKTLSEKLGVDAVELDKWLRKQSKVAVRQSKEEGIFLYALVQRLENSEKPEQKGTAQRLLVSEEDRYASSMIHSSLFLLEGALRKYAVPISAKSMEAYTMLVQAREKLQAGEVLLLQSLKGDIKKLPDLPG